MSCDHVGGPELIEMAEEHLRSSGVPPATWDGSKFRFTQNLTDSMWASICVEIERRGKEWIVTRLDRRKVPATETGFEVLDR